MRLVRLGKTLFHWKFKKDLFSLSSPFRKSRDMSRDNFSENLGDLSEKKNKE